jgi:death-on-curing protein
VRYLTLSEVLRLHERVVKQSGGSIGLRDRGGLESCVAQPHQSFGGEELYPTLADKAAALGFFLVANHPFIDGNKRIGHASMEVMLLLNGFELDADVDEQERVILAVAAGTMEREEFTRWVATKIKRAG